MQFNDNRPSRAAVLYQGTRKLVLMLGFFLGATACDELYLMKPMKPMKPTHDITSRLRIDIKNFT